MNNRLPEWVERVMQRIRDNRCVVCGGTSSGHYNSFPLCTQDDVILARRIHKAESYSATILEAGMSVAREICIDSTTHEEAAGLILVEYGGYRGLLGTLAPFEVDVLETNFPQVVRYLREWDARAESDCGP